MLNNLINTDILKNPLNWGVVFFMVLIPLIALSLVNSHMREVNHNG